MAGKIPDEWFRPENPSPPPAPIEADTTEIPVVSTESFISSFQSFQPEAEEPEPRRRRSGRSGRIIAVFAIIGALALGLLLGHFFRDSPSIPDAAEPSPSQRVLTSKGATAAFNGRVRAVVPTSATSSCASQPATDSLGQPVTYEPDLAFDGKLETAWRCDGSAVGQTLSFTLPAGTEIVRLAVFNGYGKQDPKTGDFLYFQYRRVLSVSWQLPDGKEISQNLAENGSGLQQIDIPRTTVDGEIKMKITASTAPGWATVPTRDAVLISEVQFLAPAQ